MDKSKLKILLGSCGGLTGVYLAKLLKRNFFMDCFVYGADISENIPTKKFLDNFIRLPNSQDEKEFIDSLIFAIINERIDIYIPTHSKETYVVSKYEKYLVDNIGAKFVISPFDTYRELDNKLHAYKKLKEFGLDTPRVYNSVDEIDQFPVFTKPIVGSGSHVSFKVMNLDQARTVCEIYPGNFFMEYLSGKEYTIDCVFDTSGSLISFNQRTREKMLGGAAVITKNNFSIDFEREITNIARAYKIKGSCNFQFFFDGKRKILTDINLRFASGGLPLTVESGVNVLEIIVKMLLGIPIDKQKYASDRKSRTMYRYFEEYFEVG